MLSRSPVGVCPSVPPQEKLVGPSLVDPVGRDDHGQGLSPVSCALKGCTVS